MTKTRREFLSDTFSTAGTFGVAAALAALNRRVATGEESQRTSHLRAVNDTTTGLPLLRLPEGFTYQSFGWTGEPMADGLNTPHAHDGMGVVRSDGGILKLVRNHEVSADSPAWKSKRAGVFDSRAGGGCVTLEFDPERGEFLDSYASVSGTSRNCAGGITPWGTWLTCEETVLGADSIDRYKDDVKRNFEKEHGWIFEIDADGTAKPTPIKGMGRFVHEAVAVDRETGIVYETEDRGTSAFYRFVPLEPGNLGAGGTLQVAEVVGQSDLRGGVTAGEEFSVRWHDIPDPEQANTPGLDEPDELGVYTQAKSLGASTFARLEGCWAGNGLIYFDATSGGEAKAGQIFQYNPKTEKLSLLFESPAKPVLNMPDNLCVSPAGGILLCEDNDYGANEFPQRMFALSQEGKLALFAENNVQLPNKVRGFQGDFRTKEWAGACFSPDGKWLFVNIQTPGMTFAITGPWQDTLLG
ncbi:MAG: alkaline phosphatase PhoX [Planctomycetota bacterium]